MPTYLQFWLVNQQLLLKSRRGSIMKVINKLVEKGYLYWHRNGTYISDTPAVVIELPESDDE